MGFLVLKYRKQVYDWTGTWYWAEKYLGRGGTITALILIALAMIVFGIATMFGQVDLTNRPPENLSEKVL